MDLKSNELPYSETCQHPQNEKPLKGILKNLNGEIKPCSCQKRELSTIPPRESTDPFTKPHTSSGDNFDAQDDDKQPCYFPQPEDFLPTRVVEEGNGQSGAWATGRVDYGDLSGLTGTRPVVDKYSITRFSEGEWRKRNKKVLDGSGLELHNAGM